MSNRQYLYTKGRNKKLLLEKNPKTCQTIWDSLPLELHLSTWGEELYGTIPVNVDAENSQTECEIGDIGYWPDGNGFCIFFWKDSGKFW